MKQVFVKCVSKHERLTLGKKYMAYSHVNPLRPLTEEEWLNMTQEDLLVVIADNDVKISFAKWRFIRADVEEVIESAKFESTLGQIDELEDEFEENNREMVNHPSHYNQGKYEVIDIIEDWNLNFNLGSAVKYIGRAGYKDDIIQDLEKAKWYIQREIDRIKKERN